MAIGSDRDMDKENDQIFKMVGLDYRSSQRGR